MICDNCGKNNPNGAINCSYCGVALPPTTATTGFADILTLNVHAAPANQTASPEDSIISEGMYDADMQKLLKKSDRIYKSTQQNTKFGMIAIALSLVIFLSSLLFGILTLNKVNAQMDEIEAIKETLSILEEKNSASTDAAVVAETQEDAQKEAEADKNKAKQEAEQAERDAKAKGKVDPHGPSPAEQEEVKEQEEQSEQPEQGPNEGIDL